MLQNPELHPCRIGGRSGEEIELLRRPPRVGGVPGEVEGLAQ
ncbi:MAG TPA: hypothetical protein VNK43_01765 [Gemmatimonadales bacterium]|nr:hypothetical protein [Gemmatimonadales bacterium]